MILNIGVSQAIDSCDVRVRGAECNVYCRNNGWDGGNLAGDECRCYERVDVMRIKEKKLVLPSKRIIKEKSPEYDPPVLPSF